MGFNKFSNDSGINSAVGSIFSQVNTLVSGIGGATKKGLAIQLAQQAASDAAAERQAESINSAKLQQQVDDLKAAAANNVITPPPVVSTPQQTLSVVAPANPAPQSNTKKWIAGVVVGLIVISGGIIYFATKKQS